MISRELDINQAEQITISPRGPLAASLRPPGSKSITNRALVCAALADGTSTLQGVLNSDDTRFMIESLRQLGLKVDPGEQAQTLVIEGSGGRIPRQSADLFIGNSGTSVRFLTAMAVLGHGHYRLDGVPRMRARPIADLLDALHALGADVRSEAGTGCPPVVVHADGLRGGQAAIRGDISSQFLSGLLMVCPYASAPVELSVAGDLVSEPYVRMTLRVMRSFGVAVDEADLTRFCFPTGQAYRGTAYQIEPDASAASYFWAAAAITQGKVRVEGLSRDALQGDVQFCQILAQMGCNLEHGAEGIAVEGRPLRGVDVDMNAISDTVQTLAAVALFAEGATTIRGVAHIRHKETDRIVDLARELRKLGASVEEFPDGLRITPGELHPASIETYDDHRMAMSLALVGLRLPGVVILDPGCTSKTYPQFFDDLRGLAGS
jgi:3-phosphoshikimate 1-carboxyvinyltransferase